MIIINNCDKPINYNFLNTVETLLNRKNIPYSFLLCNNDEIMVIHRKGNCDRVRYIGNGLLELIHNIEDDSLLFCTNIKATTFSHEAYIQSVKEDYRLINAKLMKFVREYKQLNKYK